MQQQNQILNLGNLYLQAKSIVDGFMLGLHKSPYHGFSVEFSQHRPYQFGDEIRHVDWKIFAKTDRYYIKQFQEETNLSAYLLLDSSASMSYASENISKFEYAKILTASLAYLLNKQNDAVGLYVFSDMIKQYLPSKAFNSYPQTIIKTINNLEISGKTRISSTLHTIAEKISKRGLIILISDLWDEPSDILSGLKHLRYQGHEIIVFHIWDPMEVTFSMDNKLKFSDLESDETLKIDTRKIQYDYSVLSKNYLNMMKNACLEMNIDYKQIVTNEDLKNALSDFLIKRSKLY